MRLIGTLHTVAELKDIEKRNMFALMQRNFSLMHWEVFLRDLSEKQWVIILKEPSGNSIQGFSTQMLLEAHIDQRHVRAIFSGDTIIDRQFWGSTELIKVWFKLVFSLMKQYRTEELYWFLISMGFRTYRFLPIFFKEFYPRYDKTTPSFEKKLIDYLAEKKFSNMYNSKTGIIRPREKVVLKDELQGIPSHALRNRHIAFFNRINPYVSEGDELACLAMLSPDNLTSAAYRII